MNNDRISIATRLISDLFDGDTAFVRPDRLLSDLDPAIAVAIPPYAVHSIASHVAHIAWWQRQVLYRVANPNNTQIRIAGDEFPATITLEQWPDVLEDFLNGLKGLQALCINTELLEQNYATYADHPVSKTLLHFTLHNAYHLGQVVLLRRMQQAWPPAGYDPETW
jgi:uncharacterized damage-inducible protein DinB